MNDKQTSPQPLRDVPAQGRPWCIEHAAFIAAHNATVEAEGLPLSNLLAIMPDVCTDQNAARSKE